MFGHFENGGVTPRLETFTGVGIWEEKNWGRKSGGSICCRSARHDRFLPKGTALFGHARIGKITPGGKLSRRNGTADRHSTFRCNSEDGATAWRGDCKSSAPQQITKVVAL